MDGICSPKFASPGAHLTERGKRKPYTCSDTTILQLFVRRGGAKGAPLFRPFFIDGKFVSLGTPVICSDIPVFREISQDKALLRSPIDGRGWLEAIESMMTVGSALRAECARKAREFKAPTWDHYFNNVQDFLATV